MTEFQVFLYVDGLAQPLVVPVSCASSCLAEPLRRILARARVATRAEVWDGPTMIMQIDAAGISALLQLAEEGGAAPGDPGTSLH